MRKSPECSKGHEKYLGKLGVNKGRPARDTVVVDLAENMASCGGAITNDQLDDETE